MKLESRLGPELAQFPFHKDFFVQLEYLENRLGIAKEDREEVVQNLLIIAKIVAEPGFDEYQAILIGGSYSRRDKSPRVNRPNHRENSDVDLLFLVRPTGLARVGIGVPEYLYDLEINSRLRYIRERLGLGNRGPEVNCYSIPANYVIITKHASALHLLQGGTLLRGGIADKNILKEYQRFRESGLPLSYDKNRNSLTAQL